MSGMLDRAEFDALFGQFEHTAFRLEMREAYNEASEVESLRKFHAGEDDRSDELRPWLRFIRDTVSAGKRFERVRVVSLPPSDYTRYGLAGALINNQAGEDIRYLARDRAGGLPEHDFWLFDSCKLVWMHFDAADGHLMGAEIIEDPAVVVQHNYWRDLAWHRAVRREEFAIE